MVIVLSIAEKNCNFGQGPWGGKTLLSKGAVSLVGG